MTEVDENISTHVLEIFSGQHTTMFPTFRLVESWKNRRFWGPGGTPGALLSKPD